MNENHLHRDGKGGIEKDRYGEIRVCYDRACLTWASRSGAVDLVGGAAVGALVGGIIGSLAGRPGAGAAIGGLIGAGMVKANQNGYLTYGGLPLLEARSSRS